MAKELPILPSTVHPPDVAQTEMYQYSRVFCQKENSPPLRLLLEFLKSRAQAPITPPDMDESMLDEWAWVQVTLGYDRNRKPNPGVLVSGIEAPTKDVFRQREGAVHRPPLRFTTMSKQDSCANTWSARGLCSRLGSPRMI